MRLIWMCVVLVASGARVLTAQERTVGGRGEIFAGSEIENYLRFLQSEGRVALLPWSLRAFSPPQIDKLLPDSLASHPWARRYDLARRPDTRASFEWIAPTVSVRYNSGFPFGSNDGAIWAGRGLTSSLMAGFTHRFGPMSLTVAPMLWRAENDAFQLGANGFTDRLRYADGAFPVAIDRPQRFGAAPYMALDPGQSTLRVDTRFFSAGVSTANEVWGPAAHYPFILGTNAAGFPHLFVGTGSAIDLWLARVQGRVEWGELRQSDYSSVSGAAARRFMSGLILIAEPRGLRGLELGIARFYHTPWPPGGLSHRNFAKPFEAFFKVRLPNNPEFPDANQDVDNQLASLFARWVLPGSGFELYGEYGREDHSWDLRDFSLEPDHAASRLFGMRKLYSRGEAAFWTLRAEIISAEGSHDIEARPGTYLYTHGRTRQGHTNRGQILGADIGPYAGGGSLLGVDRYDPSGRWTIEWTRTVRRISDEYRVSGIEPAHRRDVVYSLGVERLLFAGSFDISSGLTGVHEFNRNLIEDASNLNVTVSVRHGGRRGPR